jgi:hypothetical protein
MSLPQTVMLSNTGNATLQIKRILITGREFSQTSTCSTTLAVGESCTISVVFAPTKKGSASATLAISDNAFPTTQQILLTGNGT